MKKCDQNNSCNGFTLLEIIVAVTVLSIMVSFMFSILTASLAMWKNGSKSIEASRVAAIGLNNIAKDLANAVCGNFTVQFEATAAGNATASTNVVIPFEAILSPTHTIGMGGSSANADGSQLIRAIVSTKETNNPYKEIGLMCVRLGNDLGPMQANKYYLVMKDLNSAVFNTSNSSSWNYNNGQYLNFIPLADNCIRLRCDYAIEPFTWNATSSSWTNSAGFNFTNAWNNNNTFEFPDKRARALNAAITSYNRLAGVMLSATVVDYDTMEKIEALKNGAALTQAEIDASDPDSTPSSPVEKLIKTGSTTVRKFVPFNPSQY